MPTDTRWCFAWKAPAQPTEAARRAALVKDAKWSKGETITVSFIDGDKTVQDRVRDVAKEWVGPGMADLDLSFVPKGAKSLVRISFQYSGSWSTIGTTCRQVPANEPTMNYGWLTPNSDDDELRRVVLHEFGHALGLIHEHQNPAGGINWNRDAVIRDLSNPPNSWSLEDIESNMFEPYAKADTNFGALDKSSIMMYPIPPSWTTDGFTVDLNGEMSAEDKRFIREQYG